MPEHVEIRPLEIVTRAFPARPSALPDVRDFVRRHLSDRPVSDDDVRVLGERVAGVLLSGAGSAGVIEVSLRILPSSAEVDVVFVPATAPAPPPLVSGQTFAAWLTDRLRAEGLTIEAAARRLEVSTKTISRWMAGVTEPRLRDLVRIRASFGEPPFH
ncbi:helix-turn-helix transcriptional regulator [Actinoplanes sp. LDG1-06]|uniref:Helix-turn-helix transcriptional regulator n=1 Tax=Paractinoplanes ovalisporus TaxID=2810368 RepID=A0ABS2A281_9ACTN|nr:helix-turn-helix transcriptional regulator [Actinoplanes ovalisporus]MBM2613951.1 helix-turn-helix transcriptional regulator [Actinoplanes ovalisporus]